LEQVLVLGASSSIWDTKGLAEGYVIEPLHVHNLEHGSLGVESVCLGRQDDLPECSDRCQDHQDHSKKNADLQKHMEKWMIK
jgi:hypothetical protein